MFCCLNRKKQVKVQMNEKQTRRDIFRAISLEELRAVPLLSDNDSELRRITLTKQLISLYLAKTLSLTKLDTIKRKSINVLKLSSLTKNRKHFLLLSMP